MAARVLKPPGGGSSDIFGASGDIAEPQRKTKTNHLTSSLNFGGEDFVTPSRNRAGNDSFYNLFGTEPHNRPQSAVKENVISNIVLDQSSTDIEEKIVKKSLNFSENNSTENTVSVTNGNTPSHVESSETNGSADTNGSFCGDEDILFPDCTPEQTSSTDTPRRPEVSPVTIEAPSVNGTATTNSAASTPAPTPTAVSAPSAARPRVPPGGFSSGLW